MVKRVAPSEPSQRMLRVGEEIRHIVAECLREGSFDDETLYEIAHSINVTQVTVSPDLKYATAYILGLGGADLAHILPALNGHAHEFQQAINRGLKMKFTPKVQFKMDDTYDRVGRIEKILHDISTKSQ